MVHPGHPEEPENEGETLSMARGGPKTKQRKRKETNLQTSVLSLSHILSPGFPFFIYEVTFSVTRADVWNHQNNHKEALHRYKNIWTYYSPEKKFWGD